MPVLRSTVLTIGSIASASRMATASAASVSGTDRTIGGEGGEPCNRAEQRRDARRMEIHRPVGHHSVA